MFPNLFRLITRRPSPEYELGFVAEVKTAAPRTRNPRIDRLFLLGWILIGLKSVFVVWAVDRYHIPFSPLWVILPTVAFGGLCSAVYFGRR
jgi:hypothetical protein